MHHAFADTPKDVHSPKNDKNFFVMMIKTDRVFRDIRLDRIEVEERFKKNLPMWAIMEKYAYTWTARIFWLAVYATMYYFLIPENATWMWLLLPLHCLMTPLQGAIVNWWAHLIGYTNYKVSDTSKNLVPFDFLMMGEGYHNNHHAQPANPNFSRRWYELDPIYPIILLLDALGIIETRTSKASKKGVAA